MRVAVAMSGGVDSSVAAALLVAQGHDVVGLHMKLHDAPPGSASCCGLDDALDAAAVADRLQIPYFAFDLREVFHARVVDDLVNERIAGRTPIPCVQCNGQVKFPELLNHATALGCEALATGHYARLIDVDGAPTLHTAADPSRDQSYFLWSVDPALWARVLFPLGDVEKTTVREEARRLGLPVADKPDSQEVCFVPDGDHGAFVSRTLPELSGVGRVLDESGAVVGKHDAYWRFTPGQRRGVGVALGAPAFVEQIDPLTHDIHLTTDPKRLLSTQFFARRAVWHGPVVGDDLTVRVRHRGRRIPCAVRQTDPVECTLLAPERAVAAGQSAVWYRGERVVGGALISKTVAAWS